MTGNPYAQGAANPYQGQAVQTATPAQLVLMLYDGALTAIGRVRNAHGQGGAASLAIVNKELQRIQAIIAELQVSLDFEKGSPIAGYFAALYDFCQHELIDVAISKAIADLDAVEQILQELREAWDTACVKGSPQVEAARPTQQPVAV